MSNKDAALIWEAYESSLEEGFGKTLGMLGVGALAAYGGLKAADQHKPEKLQKHTQEAKPQSHNQSNKFVSKSNDKMAYISAIARIAKTRKFDTKYGVPVGKDGKPLVNFLTLKRLQQDHNQPVTELASFNAVVRSANY